VTHAEGQILHHAAHAAEALHALLGVVAARGDEVLDAAVGINLHGAEVGVAVDEAGVLAELLVEGVAEVVRRVGGDEQDRLARLGELDGEGAGGGRLADAALAAG